MFAHNLLPFPPKEEKKENSFLLRQIAGVAQRGQEVRIEGGRRNMRRLWRHKKRNKKRSLRVSTLKQKDGGFKEYVLESTASFDGKICSFLFQKKSKILM